MPIAKSPTSLIQGEVTNYNHPINGTYKLPLDKLLTDWLSADTRAKFVPLGPCTVRPRHPGNTIQNSRNLVNTQANLRISTTRFRF